MKLSVHFVPMLLLVNELKSIYRRCSRPWPVLVQV